MPGRPSPATLGRAAHVKPKNVDSNQSRRSLNMMLPTRSMRRMHSRLALVSVSPAAQPSATLDC